MAAANVKKRVETLNEIAKRFDFGEKLGIEKVALTREEFAVLAGGGPQDTFMVVETSAAEQSKAVQKKLKGMGWMPPIRSKVIHHALFEVLRMHSQLEQVFGDTPDWKRISDRQLIYMCWELHMQSIRESANG